MSSELRLEILKLVHRHDLSPEAIVTRAKAIEAYVTEQQNAQVPERKTLTAPKPGTR